MKKLTSLILALLILLSNIYLLPSCKENNNSSPPPENNDEIITPEGITYSKDTVSFQSIEYNRPDVQAAVEQIKGVAEKIKLGVSFDEGIELIKSIEDKYVTVNTMYTVAEIHHMQNTSDAYWMREYEYISTRISAFSDAVEEIFVACAQSADRERYENEYFMYSLDKYVDGGIYTDEVIALMKREAELEAEYTAISEATVTITYQGITDTYENILLQIKNTHGSGSGEYIKAEEECYSLLYDALVGKWRKIFIELLKVRRNIADELGEESYSDYAYSAMGYDYTSNEMMSLLRQIKTTVYPVYKALYERAFRSFFYSTTPSESLKNNTVNTLYYVYDDIGGYIKEAYSYMLTCRLYDINTASKGRYKGAFTAHIASINAPYLFMTADGYTTDYLTLAHEYGHFLDGYINGSGGASLDLSEISSQAMELITVSRLKGHLSDKDVKFLEYYQMYNALDVLLVQSLFSAFEHLAYQLDYEEINEENLNRITAEASIMIFGKDYYKDFGDMLIHHTVVYPHYVQSYCTSVISSLEIFFIEKENEGEGMDIYLDLITRDSEESLTYLEELEAVRLSSPFEQNTLKYVMNTLHYHILGSNYFKEIGDSNAA